MKKGIYFGFLPGEGPDAKLAAAAELGFQCVEVATLRTDADRQVYAKAAKAAGIAISSVMNSDHWSSPLSDPDPAVRQKSAAGVVQSLETAAALGADTVLIVPAVVKPTVPYEEAWRVSRDTIGALLPKAAACGVALAVENVWNRFLLSPIEFAAYVDSFASPWLAAYFDVGNIVAYGYPQHWIRSLGKRIRKIHIKGFDSQKHAFVQLLEGNVDWKEVTRALRDIGYDDVVTAELKGPGDNPHAAAKAISQDMNTILAMDARA